MQLSSCFLKVNAFPSICNSNSSFSFILLRSLHSFGSTTLPNSSILLIILFFAITLEFLAIYKFFKIKRFKNGLTFFKDKNRPYDLAIFLSGIVILIITSLGNYINQSTSIYSFLSLILILASIFIWIKKRITLHYRNLLTKDTIADLQTKLDKQISINNDMKTEIEKLSKINHKYSSRLSALELYVNKLSNKSTTNENINNNILEAKEIINTLSTEFV